MAIRTIRRNGRNITIDTKTGKEVKPGTRPLSFARRLARRLQRLPGDMVTQAMAAKKDIGDNLVYSSKTDKKGKPLTIAQAKAVKTPAYRGPGGNPNKSGEGQAQQRSKSKSTATTPVKAKPTAKTANTPRPTAKANPQPKPKPKSKIHTYKEHGSDLHIGRHKTLKQHQKAVAARKAAEKKDRKTPPVFGPRA